MAAEVDSLGVRTGQLIVRSSSCCEPIEVCVWKIGDNVVGDEPSWKVSRCYCTHLKLTVM